ncbi:MAG: CDP-alcohol phosphatidyltransferase family protein [Salinivirgaceae bacterium]
MKKIIYKGENILNVPNMLSLYRLLVAPLIFYFVLSGQEKMYAIFICISLVSDVLDGNISRLFKLQTKFGAALDNLADMFTYAMAFIGIYFFKWNEIAPHATLLYIFIGTLILSYIVAFIKFKKIPGLHLYSAVSSGYVQGLFIFCLFAFGFYPWMFYVVTIWGTIAYVEKIFVLIRLNEIRSGVKGLYWLRKEQHNKA